MGQAKQNQVSEEAKLQSVIDMLTTIDLDYDLESRVYEIFEHFVENYKKGNRLAEFNGYLVFNKRHNNELYVATVDFGIDEYKDFMIHHWKLFCKTFGIVEAILISEVRMSDKQTETPIRNHPNKTEKLFAIGVAQNKEMYVKMLDINSPNTDIVEISETRNKNYNLDGLAPYELSEGMAYDASLELRLSKVRLFTNLYLTYNDKSIKPDKICNPLGTIYKINLQKEEDIQDDFDNFKYFRLPYNLYNAFAELRRSGYFAKMNFSCCRTCGWAEVPDEYEFKAVFYSSQDQQDLEETGSCYLSWSGDGFEITDIMKDYGIRTEWDGTENARIQIFI